MATIPLTKGYAAEVDDGDASDLLQYRWCAKIANGTVYALRCQTPRNAQRKQVNVLMHRHIAKPGEGMEVDHIDGNGLNNRRANLRVVSRAVNAGNTHRRRPNGRALPMGVGIANSKALRYCARIKRNYKMIHLGTFTTVQDAEAAYLKVRNTTNGVPAGFRQATNAHEELMPDEEGGL